MTARMMMLNWVQETSVSAAVVLSVGLLRLVRRAWVVEEAEEDEEDEGEKVEEGDGLNVALMLAVVAVVTRIRGAEEREGWSAAIPGEGMSLWTHESGSW